MNNNHEIIDLIHHNFQESIAAKQAALAAMNTQIAQAIQLLTTTFKNDNKLLICGNGGSAADSQHFAAEFTGRYEIERKPLPAIALTTDTSALTAIGNDYSFDVIFSKQVEALGRANDVLFAISTSGNSANVIAAIHAAQTQNMHIVALTGKDGGKIAQMLRPQDINLCVPVTRTARIQEVHILIMHILCDAIDTILFKIR